MVSICLLNRIPGWLYLCHMFCKKFSYLAPTTCGSYIGLFSSSCTFVSILVRFLMLCKRTYLSFGGPYRCNPIPLFIFRHTCTACSISQVYPNDIIIVIPSIYRMYIYICVCLVAYWWLPTIKSRAAVYSTLNFCQSIFQQSKWFITYEYKRDITDNI